MDVYQVVQRGFDSSGRPLKNTRLKWAAFDRINREMGGILVIVQGAFMGDGGASASAGTHAFAGCNDVRRWNLTSAQAAEVIRIANRVGDIWWERTAAQGFDPHFHNLLPNDRPLHQHAANQVVYFNRGENGLASHGRDTHARPSRPLPLFTFQEDDMFEEADRRKLDAILARVDKGFDNEAARDAAERERDKKRHQKLTETMGQHVDQMGLVLNMLREDDSATAREVKQMLRESRRKLLLDLKEDPATDGTPDNPSDESVEQA